ncbi:YitT family protein [Peptoclostridium litorale]|nr:YitT family protein [Peptoclostridium litorale]
MKEKIIDMAVITLGAIFVAVGLYYFLAPNEIAAGGISGLAIIINSYFPSIPMGILMIGMEIILFTAGILIIGPIFGGKTIYCSFMLSGIILFFEKVMPIQKPLSDDIFIQLVIGIILTGFGMSLAFNRNASTGGTDIIAKIINKYLKFNIGKSVLMADALITVFAIGTFGIEKGMYALVGLVMNSIIIDRFIEGFNMCKQITIISSEKEAIMEFIMKDLDRSATIYDAKGAFTEDEKTVIMTVVDTKQFIRLREFIKKIDKRAFITVQNVHEVLGEGFIEIA